MKVFRTTSFSSTQKDDIFLPGTRHGSRANCAALVSALNDAEKSEVNSGIGKNNNKTQVKMSTLNVEMIYSEKISL